MSSNPTSPNLDLYHHHHDHHPLTMSVSNEHDMMDTDVPQPSQGSGGEVETREDPAAASHQDEAAVDAEIEDLIANAKHASEDTLSILDSLKHGRSADQADQGAALNVALMLNALSEALENAEPRPNDLSLLQFVEYSFPFYEMTPESAQADLAELQKAAEFMGDQAHDHQTYVKYLTAIMDKENPEWVKQEEANEVALACQEYDQVIGMHLKDVELMGGDIAELALDIENSERSLHAAVAQLTDLVATYDSFPDPLTVYPDSTIDEQAALLERMDEELTEIHAGLADLEPAMAAGPEKLADLDRELARLDAENALLEQEAVVARDALEKVEDMHRGMNPEIGQKVIAQRNKIDVLTRLAGVANVTPVVLELRTNKPAATGTDGMADGAADMDAVNRALVENVLGADAHRKYTSPALVLDLLDVRGSDLSLAVGDHTPYRRQAIVAEVLDSGDLHVHVVLTPAQDSGDAMMPPAPTLLVVGSALIPQSSKVRVNDQAGLRRVVNTPADPFRGFKTLHQLIKRANAVLVRDALVEYLEQAGGFVCTVADEVGASSGETRVPWVLMVSTSHESALRVEMMVSRESGKVVRTSLSHTGGWSREKRDKANILGGQLEANCTFDGVLAFLQEVLGSD